MAGNLEKREPGIGTWLRSTPTAPAKSPMSDKEEAQRAEDAWAGHPAFPLPGPGFDIAKSVFQVHGIDAEGKVLIRRKLKRRYLLSFFQSCSRA